MPKRGRSQKSYTIDLEGIGSVLLKRSTRAKYLNIRIKPLMGVQVAVPVGVTFSQAERMVRARRQWIEKHLEKVKEIEKEAVIYDGLKPVRTRSHRLDVKAGPDGAFSVRLVKGSIKVRYPATFKITDQAVQAAILRGLIAAYRKEAKAYLPKRLEQLANKYDFSYNRVFIKNHRSRWGSCSAKNNINLNLHLMRLPDDLIDYVLIHELVHTEVKNHGPKFWNMMEEKCKDAKILSKRLRTHNLIFPIAESD